ncbi:hypothetical protein KDH_22050 [Dictyobacter sp. S3.2.2.5]|uniref:Band 7 domain-containing protein n=1 Tax=Dictyobacter halimunensis TaxID=3026934 RepID=A0ABQ6FSB4_9CHLR|nr:hypothetical protein KDH_22050 [Dictyobacter sp. S3.2.2.5]
MNNTLLDLITKYPAVFIVVAVVIICLLLILFISALREQRRTIEVSQSGITTYGGGESGYVPWQDARLFAVYRSFNARDDQFSLTYELSSATDIVRWTAVVRHPVLSLLHMTPDISQQEYQQQIQALNALVVARTSLSLYDLRNEFALDNLPQKR